MPVRIKPVRNLGPCTLDLKGIKGICELMDKEFDCVSYTAEDDIWIVHDEPSFSFLQFIEERDRLDSFTVAAPPSVQESAIKIEAGLIENVVVTTEEGPTLTSSSLQPGKDKDTSTIEKKVKLVFNSNEAKVIFDISPDEKDWLDHFLLDLNKCIGPPTFFQRFGGFPIPILFLGGGSAAVIPIEQPYCRINLKPRQPNQRLIGIGDNIAANVIYDVLKVAIGVIVGGFAAWLLARYGVDILGNGGP